MHRHSFPPARATRRTLQRTWRFLALLLSTILALLPALAAPVGANPEDVGINSVTFSGPGYSSGSTASPPILLLSNSGVTLTVVTDTLGGCLILSGGFTGSLSSPTSSTATTKTWAFNLTAPASGGGSVTITAHNNNNCTLNGHTASTTVNYTVLVRPTLAATASPAPNAGGWNNGDVTVSLTAGANGGSAVQTITYSASGAQAVGSTTVNGATATVTISAEGTTVLTATARNADNIASLPTTTTIKIDRSAPTITGGHAPAPNANGWNNAAVAVSFTCTDNGPSGIASCTPAATLSGEGAGQSAAGTATDNAGNSASATVSGINIDTTAPTLSGTPTTAPNGAGWYNGDVIVAWACADALSGIDGPCPANSTITGEGSGLTAGASVSDKAGNTTNGTSSPAVNIDRTPPATGHNAPGGWNNATVAVVLSPADALSGVAATHYTLDGGAQQTGTSVSISGEGTHTLVFWSVDNAGNTEAAHTVQVKIDLTAPTISHTQTPAANSNGWNNGSVTVTFTCDDLGGADLASCTTPQTVTTEGQNQPVTGTATDNVGNTATDPAAVNIDLTAPTITGGRAPAANANGWNNAAVTVSFSCGDALSGIDICTAPTTLSGEGAGQSIAGTATDAAGNSASATVSGINIDTTNPTIGGAATTAPNASGWYHGDVAIAWVCADALSGIDGACPANGTITGEGANLSATASVGDRAGNSASATVSGIKIDRTAPTTSASVPAPPPGGYVGSVTVTLTASDGLSGVAATYYHVDGGATQTYAGPFALAVGGAHTVTFWSVDNAGNTEDGNATGHQLNLTIDTNVITFGPLADRTLGDPPFAVSASATSGLPVTFTAGPPGVCTISGATITIVGVGVCTVVANQAGGGTHNAATPVSRSFTVTAAPVQYVLLTMVANGGGTVARDLPGTGSGPFGYPVGTLVTLTPQPAAGKTFIGWTVDGTYQGWPKPMDITMNANHTVVANFAPTKAFPDVGAGRADYQAVVQLASRVTILGYTNGNYGPDDNVQRAQMAALIARATPSGPGVAPASVTPPACTSAGTWDCENWGTAFTDQDGVSGSLWRDAGTLAHYGVSVGYTPADCAARGKAAPCFGPLDNVTYAQTISFITRMMIVKGYWVAQPGAPLPYAGVPAAHATDVRTFTFYTQGMGGVPAPPANWNAPATRGWFAMALWRALDSYWSVDRVP